MVPAQRSRRREISFSQFARAQKRCVIRAVAPSRAESKQGVPMRFRNILAAATAAVILTAGAANAQWSNNGQWSNSNNGQWSNNGWDQGMSNREVRMTKHQRMMHHKKMMHHKMMMRKKMMMKKNMM
jgi:hypothetical protein